MTSTRDIANDYLYQSDYRRYTSGMPYAKLLRGLLWALAAGHWRHAGGGGRGARAGGHAAVLCANAAAGALVAGIGAVAGAGPRQAAASTPAQLCV